MVNRFKKIWWSQQPYTKFHVLMGNCIKTNTEYIYLPAKAAWWQQVKIIVVQIMQVTVSGKLWRLSTYGNRAFPVAAVRIWNSPPQHVTSAPSLPVFCICLKWSDIVILDTLIVLLTYLLTYTHISCSPVQMAIFSFSTSSTEPDFLYSASRSDRKKNTKLVHDDCMHHFS